MIKIGRFSLLSLCLLCCSGWGFYAHKKINRTAVFTLPAAMSRFYKSNLPFITEHAVDPDKRRYSDSLEAPRHYLDADHYGKTPFRQLPEQWSDAVKKYGEHELTSYGILPWQIERSYRQLVSAFQRRDSSAILRRSSEIGHYLADAHVPLHATENYNGQLSGQTGIHAFWESRLPELFSGKYDFFTGRARYLPHPLQEAWKIIRHSFELKDTVLLLEARLNARYPSDKKYTYTNRNGRLERNYSEEYATAYHKALNGMVEEQMKAAIYAVGSYWYSAWVDAGQPILAHFPDLPSAQDRVRDQQEEDRYLLGTQIGREPEY